MASVINNIKSNSVVYNIASTAYATCATSASTAAKVAYIQGETSSSGFTLTTGTTVHVKFTYANEASSPTLNINGTGAKTINCPQSYSGGSLTYNHYAYWEAGEVVTLTYDGTYWQINKSMPNFSILNARLTALEQQLSSVSVINTLLIEMNGSGSIITHTDSSDSVATYNIKLYSSGASMGHTRWDSTTPTAQNPIASPTSTLSSVFYYKHHRIAIAIPANMLTEIANRTLVGLDLYFSTNSIDTSGYTGFAAITEPLSTDQAITINGDTLFTVYEDVGEFNEGILHLDFTRPYAYASGSNLLILIKYDSSSYNSSHSIYGKVNLYYR